MTDVQGYISEFVHYNKDRNKFEDIMKTLDDLVNQKYDIADKLLERLEKKYNINFDGFVSPELIGIKVSPVVKMDTMTLTNYMIQFDRYVYYDFILPIYFNLINKYNPDKLNPYEWLRQNSTSENTLTNGWIEYTLRPELVQEMQAYLDLILADISRMFNIKNAISAKIEALRKEALTGRREVKYSIYESWETGLRFFVLLERVDENTFKRLVKEAGLMSHAYNAELEERFTGWSTSDISTALEVLYSENYYIESLVHV